jgi:hypothetical protein
MTLTYGYAPQPGMPRGAVTPSPQIFTASSHHFRPSCTTVDLSESAWQSRPASEGRRGFCLVWAFGPEREGAGD